MSDLKHLFPDNAKVREREDRFKRFFEKYENCGDTEADGYDFADLIACGEVEDEENEELFCDEDEAVESDGETEDAEENIQQQLLVYDGKPNNLEVLGNIYGPDFVQRLSKAYKERRSELDNMGLAFWKRSKTEEAFNESNIKTPTFEASSRSFFRSSEQISEGGKETNALSPTNPVNLNRDNFGLGNFPQNMYPSTSAFDSSQRLPFQMNDVMNGSQKINMRIREMHYDFSVDGRDVTELFLPNCNSTFKNAIPAFGNSSINNTNPNMNLTGAIGGNFPTIKNLPAIEYNADKVRREPTQKVNEKPELDSSNVESLNNSIAEHFGEISINGSSHKKNVSKDKKKYTKKSSQKKRNEKPKQKNVKHEQKDDEKVKPAKSIAPVSQKLELSYSDVVKLSPKQNLKDVKHNKPVADLKNKTDEIQNKKDNREKNHEKMLKKYRRIIDSDTSSTEDQFESKTNEKQVPTKVQKKIEDSKNVTKNEVPIKPQEPVQKLEKTKDVTKNVTSDKIREKTQKSSLKTREEDQKYERSKDIPKSKECAKFDIPDKAEASTKIQKSGKSKDTKQMKETTKKEKPRKNQDKVQMHEKQERQPKSTESTKVNTRKYEDKKEIQREQTLEPSNKSKKTSPKEPPKKVRNDKYINHEDYELQYDKNGVPFREINGFILRYEGTDSDSSIDDTEFFRQVHAKIRQEKALQNKRGNAK